MKDVLDNSPVAVNLKINLEFPPHGRAQAVEKLAELQAAKIALHVTWIEVIRNVENDGPRARRLVQKRYREAFEDRDIQRKKSRKTFAVANAHKIQSIVHH